MEVNLTPDQEAFIRQRVSTGRFATADEALQAAVSLLEERERPGATGADLVDAMQASPYRDIELETSRPHLPVRNLAI